VHIEPFQGDAELAVVRKGAAEQLRCRGLGIDVIEDDGGVVAA
jgi:hypothetical protein